MSYLAHGSQYYFPKSIKYVLWPACDYNKKFLKLISVRLAASIKQELLNRGSVLFTRSQEKNHILSNEYLSEAKKRIYCYYFRGNNTLLDQESVDLGGGLSLYEKYKSLLHSFVHLN